MALTQNILVATDFSDAARLALEAAAILAEQNGAKVTLVHVVDPRPVAVRVSEIEPSAESLRPDQELADAIHARLKEIREHELKDVPSVKTVLITSRNAADGICHYAEKEGVDMIVISTHGRSGLSHMLIGSVAEKVLRHSPCPVLTLRSNLK